jgi:hypothetical protein
VLLIADLLPKRKHTLVRWQDIALRYRRNALEQIAKRFDVVGAYCIRPTKTVGIFSVVL